MYRMCKASLSLLLLLLPLAVTAHASTPTVTLGVDASSVALGDRFTFTATVSGGPVHAIVRFCDATRPRCEDTAVLATRSLTSNHTASFVLRTGVGSHSVKAAVLGAMSAAQTVTVTGTPAVLITAQQTGAGTSYAFDLSVLGTATKPPTGVVGAYEESYSPYPGAYASATLGNQAKAISLTQGSYNAIADLSFGSIAVGDLENSGSPDLVASLQQANQLAVGSNFQGNFDLQLNSAYATGAGPSGVALGDFNADGNVDAVSANSLGNSLTILLGHGDGTLTPLAAAAPSPCARPNDVLAADLDGDGILDLAVACDLAAGEVTVLHGMGDGTFRVASTEAVGSYPLALATADFNGDGHPDLVTASFGDDTVSLLTGRGDGTFLAAKTIFQSPSLQPVSVVSADFNGDGYPDLAVVSASNGAVIILLNDGRGSFSAAPGQPPAIPSASSVVIGDFNGDGIADLAVGGSVSTVILLGLGDGIFKQAVKSASLPYSYAGLIAVADLNGDGVPDLMLGGGNGFAPALVTTTVATANLSGIYLPGSGQQTLSFRYDGDANDLPMRGAAVEVAAINFPSFISVNPLPPAPAGSSQAITVSLSFYSDQTYPSGTVTFMSGPTVLGTSFLDKYGRGPFVDTSSFAPGLYPVQAIYSGDGFNAPSTSPVAYIEITGRAGENNPQLKGQYAFLISGSTTTPGLASTSRAIAAAGSFTADGNGNITAGIEDVNSGSVAISGASVTGTYSINGDDRGLLTLKIPGQPTQTYAVVIETPLAPTALATAASLTSILPGMVASGRLAAQTAPAASLGSSSFGFALSGETACTSACSYAGHPGGPIGVSGLLNFGTGAALTGTATANLASAIAVDQPFSGGFASVSPTFKRFTMSFSSPGEAPDLPRHFVGYLVDASHIFLLSTDPHASSALLEGTAVLQGVP